MKARKSKANAHASGVGFYSYMRAKGYPQYQSESVDEVISPRFFSVSLKPSDYTQLLT